MEVQEFSSMRDSKDAARGVVSIRSKERVLRGVHRHQNLRIAVERTSTQGSSCRYPNCTRISSSTGNTVDDGSWGHQQQRAAHGGTRTGNRLADEARDARTTSKRQTRVFWCFRVNCSEIHRVTSEFNRSQQEVQISISYRTNKGAATDGGKQL